MKKQLVGVSLFLSISTVVFAQPSTTVQDTTSKTESNNGGSITEHRTVTSVTPGISPSRPITDNYHSQRGSDWDAEHRQPGTNTTDIHHSVTVDHSQ